MSQDFSIDIFLGLDVGKSKRHTCSLEKRRKQTLRQTTATVGIRSSQAV